MTTGWVQNVDLPLLEKCPINCTVTPGGPKLNSQKKKPSYSFIHILFMSICQETEEHGLDGRQTSSTKAEVGLKKTKNIGTDEEIYKKTAYISQGASRLEWHDDDQCLVTRAFPGLFSWDILPDNFVSSSMKSRKNIFHIILSLWQITCPQLYPACAA